MMNLALPPHYCKTDVMRSVLVHADCFDVFPYIADKSVNLILCDLPYGTTANKWDSLLDLNSLWKEYERILAPKGNLTAKYMPMKKHEMVLVFGKSASYYKPQLTEGTPYKRKWTPNKVNNMEYGIAGVITDNKGTRHPTTILDFPQQWRRQDQLHPTQKPVELAKWLIEAFSNEDDVVMDNCMGSNTTGLACKELNRQYIGIEKDKNYYDISVSRVLS